MTFSASVKTGALAVCAAVAGIAAAEAADMAVKAPVHKAPVLQDYDWTGFYIGANLGGSVGRSRTHSADAGPVNENETTYLQAVGAIGGG